MKTWNRERKRTRDRLLDFSFIIPPEPSPSIIPYPDFSFLKTSIYAIAVEHGYSGTEEEFWSNLGNNELVVGTLATFPAQGDTDCLYLDSETSTLYHYIKDNT